MKIVFALATVALVYLLFKIPTVVKGVDDNRAEGQAFLEQNASAEGVTTTASGLQYLVLQPGTGSTHPSPTDKVKVHYHGTLIGGTVFDSSVERGEPIDIGLNQVIQGWSEGLQLMVVGEKTRLFIPADLAYGNRGVGKIGPGSMLIFDVELLEIAEEPS
ncbi:MAG TPA: peptidylprolyl isomerase [Gammaproteobacteria bacterium]|nr:peptidylprolyl isomerase [Gammaproteobacteria bacterium]